MKRSILFTLICSLISILNVKAQNDFIVTKKGDTLKGEIKNRFEVFISRKGVKFKEIGSSDFKLFSPDSLLAYYKSEENIFYLQKKMPEEKEVKLTKCLENGKIQLFEYYKSSGYNARTYSGYSSTIWYACKDNSELVEIKSSRISGSREERKENFYNLIASYPELLTDFKAEKNFSFDMLRSYIKKYNYYYKNLPKDKVE